MSVEPDKSVISDIIRARENIKTKCNELKNGKFETDALISDTFGSIIDPLNKIHRQQQLQQQHVMQSAASVADELYNNNNYNSKTENAVTASSINFSDLYQRLESSRDLDKVYGVRKLRNDRFILGDKNVNFTPEEVQIVNDDGNNVTSYPLTSGLCNLLLDKDVAGYSENDLNAYRWILVQTSAHLTRKNQTIKHSRGKKFELIVKLFSKPDYESSVPQSVVGKGVNMRLQKYNFIYWNNANELVQRLRLLYASLAAGNTGVRNEIIAICEELVECKLLRKIPDV